MAREEMRDEKGNHYKPVILSKSATDNNLKY